MDEGLEACGSLHCEGLSEPCHVDVHIAQHTCMPDAEGGAVCTLVDAGLPESTLPRNQQPLLHIDGLPTLETHESGEPASQEPWRLPEVSLLKIRY